MLKSHSYNQLSEADIRSLTDRNTDADHAVADAVLRIIEEVRAKGDSALKALAAKFDRVSQENLARTRFPLGGFAKSEIRQMAREMGQEELAKKSESYEICFVPDNDYRAFLRHKRPTLDDEIGPGNFILSDGTVVGRHMGYPYFTIGQRKGLGIAMGKPVFVLEILPESNSVVLGEEHELERTQARARDINLVKYASLDGPTEAVTKIRYKDSGAHSVLTQAGDSIQVDFSHRVKGIAPGQSAVFYEGDDLVGGGFLV